MPKYEVCPLIRSSLTCHYKGKSDGTRRRSPAATTIVSVESVEGGVRTTALVNAEDPSDPIVDLSSATIQVLRNPSYLDVDVVCYNDNGSGWCAFELNDDGIIELAMAPS